MSPSPCTICESQYRRGWEIGLESTPELGSSDVVMEIEVDVETEVVEVVEVMLVLAPEPVPG
jgi:hypothetical protein